MTSTGPAVRGASRRGSRRAGVVALLLVALLGGVLLWRGLHPDAIAGAPLPDHPFDLRAAAPAAPTSPGATLAGGPVGSLPAYGPDRLGIPSLGVDAPLAPEPATAGGDLVIPGDPATVGRWSQGPPLTATAGTTLLAGHVNVADIGLGALAGLHRIEPDALIVTTDRGGPARYWRVDALLVRAKDDLPEFPPDGPRRLAIVTCGGPLQHTPVGNTYRDNVIAFARPVPGP